MYYNITINGYNLQPADRLVVPKSGIEIVQHHAIYWGRDNNGVHWMIENIIGQGVIYTEFNEFLARAGKITRVEKYNGFWWNRQSAIERAERYFGRSYHLTNFNCEHFANIVQNGEGSSNQVKVGFGIAAIAALILIGGSGRK